MAAFYVEDIVFDEGDGVVNIIVRLTEAATQAVSVNYTTANGTASGGFDYTGVSGTLNFAIGEVSKIVQVQILNDAAAENLEHFRFNLNTPVNATIAKASAMVSIVDNDTVVATPGIFVRDVVVDEKSGTASFVVMLGGPKGQASNSAVTVDYATADGTAAAGSDFTATSGTLTFAAGETVKTVTVNITDDAGFEGFERFGINLSNASGATILDGHADAMIGASDASAVALPSISVSDMVASEADGYVDIVVSLSAPGQNPVSVAYTTANGTASGGFDYTGASGTLNFALGETTKVVRVELLNDAVAENLEYFAFNLSTPVNATIAEASAMISIVDNDTVVATPGLFVRDVVVDEKAGTASFVVMLGGPKGQVSNSTVTVDYATGNSSSNATATAGSDYTAVSGTLTFAAGETVKTVVVDITDDVVAEGQERFNLNLSNAVGATILDGQGVALIGANDAAAVALPRISVSDMVASEADGYVDIVVSLSAPGQNLVSVAYTTANGTASGGFDVNGASGTLNFALGETTKVVRVELLNDAVAENLEYFAFNLITSANSPVNATIAEASAMISIVDNDTVVPTPTLFVRDVVVDEKAGTASFVVMLGGPKGQVSNSTVTVDYATGNSGSNATATAGSDYTAVSGTLTFAAGETVKTVVVDITDDVVAEGQERFDLNLSNAVGATILDGQGVAVIGANDAVAVAQPRISVSDMVASEADGYVDIVVSLSAPGQNPVSVVYTTANGTASGGFDYTGASGTLNFALGETTKVVRVELLNDAVAENLEYFAFNLSTPVNATIAEASAMVSIVDNDTVVDTPTLFVRDVVVDEKAGTASFVVMLGGPKGQVSNSTVTVDYATGNSGSNATATAGSDYTAVSGTLTFAAGETVKTVVVDITDDVVAEGQERFNLNLSNAVGATILDGQGVALIGANDAAAVALPRISVSDMVASEADGYVDIVVSLSAPGQNLVSVAYTTANGTASGGFDVNGASGTLNFALGETTKVVRVELLNDAVAENLEYFAFNLITSANSPVNATIAEASAMVSIVDNDTVVDTPTLFVRDVVVDEKSGTASFVVMLGGPNSQSSNSVVTVNYATSNSTAAAGSDYTAVSGTLTFAAGETVKTVVVDITDDAVSEGLERFNLSLSNASNAVIKDGQAVAVIGANDATPVTTPLISVADIVVGESDGYVDIVVNLSAPGQSAVAVNYTTANATASGGFDYTGASGTLNFAVGETTKVVRVELLDNITVEPLETFRFNLSSPVNATLANTFATISIVDNDTAGINVYSYGISDDIYNVSATTDVIVENPGGGYDLVNASANYTLPEQVEALVLVEGAGPLTGIGNGLANSLLGNSQNNALISGAGNDTLNGGDGNDTLNGGDGNDTLDGGAGLDATDYSTAGSALTVNLSSVIAQNTGGAGTDTLINIENLTGSAFNDIFTGNSSNNTINGGGGIDTVIYATAFRQSALSGSPPNSAVFVGPGGSDTLISIESLKFVDGSRSYDAGAHIWQIERLYGAAFDRAADVLGRNYHSGRLDSGTTLSAVAQDFAGSAEFLATYGSLNNGAFVSQLYLNVLNRPADAGGLGYWTGQIDSGAMTRGAVLAGFSDSAENIGNYAGQLAAGLWDIDETAASVARLYHGTLDRAPEAAGLGYWTDQLKSGAQTLLQEAAFFVASPEFQATYGSLNNSGFVNQLYLNVLDRPGEPGGLAYWTGLLNAGIPREDVTLGFTESAEFQVNILGQIDNGIVVI